MNVTSLIFAIAMVLFSTPAVSGRECPLESDCVQSLCNKIRYTADHRGERPFLMEATCANEAGEPVFTKLDLKKCIVNSNGLLYWSDLGDFKCQGCRIVQYKPEDTVILECRKCPKKIGEWESFVVNSRINLSSGIWVSKNGALSCYSHEGGYRSSKGISRLSGRGGPRTS
ncbi:Putative cyanovirin-N [Colletotrichum destructivum]|uniref:Cyanovirin-N n=1 Tax=Colletotrichum destructivum TaxID=34406 RepID=A0AAX4IUC0_9PEZI|nr:Putative cyanovirin-N [Colletotrichum destructivum]